LKNIKEMPLEMLKENVNSKLAKLKKQEPEVKEDLEMKRELEEKSREAGTYLS
jgi:hypothetical protein